MDRTDVLAECARDAAIAAGRLLTAILDVAANARPGFDADEIAFTLICSQNAARSQLELARFLHDTTPDVFAALCAGDIDAYRAWIFYEILHTAQVPIAAHVATAILPHAAALTPSELKQKLRRALLKADPAGATTRTRRTLADRYIAATHSEDGTASLYGVYLPAARVAAAIERIDAYARAARNAGDERTLAQLRADTFWTCSKASPPPWHPYTAAESSKSPSRMTPPPVPPMNPATSPATDPSTPIPSAISSPISPPVMTPTGEPAAVTPTAPSSDTKPSAAPTAAPAASLEPADPHIRTRTRAAALARARARSRSTAR